MTSNSSPADLRHRLCVRRELCPLQRCLLRSGKHQKGEAETPEKGRNRPKSSAPARPRGAIGAGCPRATSRVWPRGRGTGAAPPVPGPAAPSPLPPAKAVFWGGNQGTPKAWRCEGSPKNARGGALSFLSGLKQDPKRENVGRAGAKPAPSLLPQGSPASGPPESFPNPRKSPKNSFVLSEQGNSSPAQVRKAAVVGRKTSRMALAASLYSGVSMETACTVPPRSPCLGGTPGNRSKQSPDAQGKNDSKGSQTACVPGEMLRQNSASLLPAGAPQEVTGWGKRHRGGSERAQGSATL